MDEKQKQSSLSSKDTRVYPSKNYEQKPLVVESAEQKSLRNFEEGLRKFESLMKEIRDYTLEYRRFVERVDNPVSLEQHGDYKKMMEERSGILEETWKGLEKTFPPIQVRDREMMILLPNGEGMWRRENPRKKEWYAPEFLYEFDKNPMYLIKSMIKENEEASKKHQEESRMLIDIVNSLEQKK